GGGVGGGGGGGGGGVFRVPIVVVNGAEQIIDRRFGAVRESHLFQHRMRNFLARAVARFRGEIVKVLVVANIFHHRGGVGVRLALAGPLLEVHTFRDKVIILVERFVRQSIVRFFDFRSLRIVLGGIIP